MDLTNIKDYKYEILEVENDEKLNYNTKKTYILTDVVYVKELLCNNCFEILGFKVVEVYNKWDYIYKNKIFLKDYYKSIK